MKKGKKAPMWILIGYVICIIAIIGAILMIEYRKRIEEPTFVDFTTVQSIETAPEEYGFLEVEGLTEEVAIYGDIENEESSVNDRYYIAVSGGYMYIVDLDVNTINKLKSIQEYTYSQDENAVKPEAVTIYGKIESIPTELKTLVIDFYNQSVGEQYVIAEEDFELYFGSILLNARNTSPVDTIVEEMIIMFAVVAIIIIFITHIAITVIKGKTKKR